MDERRRELLRDYEVIKYAVLGRFGKGIDRVLLDGIQRIAFGDNLEINEVFVTKDYVNLTLRESDDSVNSLVSIDMLSNDLIEEILKTMYGVILT